MKTFSTTEYLHVGIRMVLAGVFAYAIAGKLFLDSISEPDSSLLGVWLRRPFQLYVLVGAEVLLVLWLVSGLWTRWSSFATLILLSCFSGVIVNEIRKDRPKPCGCTGAVAHLTDPAAIRRSLAWSLGRNGLMIAGAAWLFLSSAPKRTEPAVNPAAGSGHPPAESVPTP